MLIAGLRLFPANLVTAQTFTNLYFFTATPYSTNSDGANPYAGLILSSNTLYGTAKQGGSPAYGNGTIFKLNSNGSDFTVIHTFTAIPSGYSSNSDGANPYAGLTLSGNTLYGTANVGGVFGKGTIFAVNTDGTSFTNLHNFTGNTNDGANPYAGLILSSNTLYGTAQNGGFYGNGTVFAINADGTGFTNLHSFTFADGANPNAGLILSGNTLYGTATYGGYAQMGTVFKVNIDGTGFTNLTGFTASVIQYPYCLVLSGSTLYGTSGGGSSGTLFKVNTDGTGCTNFYKFTLAANPYYTNTDGQFPKALVLSGNTLYGTANAGGFYEAGTIFAIKTDGTGFMNLHNFTNSYGAFPNTGLIVSGNTFYGTTSGGGVSTGEGTVFSLSFPSPQLSIMPSGTNVNLKWPIGVAGFSYSGYTLQSTTNLGSSAVWNTSSTAPVAVSGQIVVTNSITGTRKFFRLSQ